MYLQLQRPKDSASLPKEKTKKVRHEEGDFHKIPFVSFISG